jgi:hypothetical protein
MASGPVFIYCAPGLVLGGAVAVGSCFHVLRTRTRFGRCGGRRFLFSCFVLSDSFSAVPRESGPIFMFCAPGLVFGGTDGILSRIHVLRSRTRFRRCRGRWFPFSCFALSDSFSAIPRSSGLVFMFCAPELIFGGTDSVLRRFRRCGGRQVQYSCFALPNSFSAVPRVLGPVFMFCAPGLVFGGTKGVRSRFLVACSRTRFRRY